MINQYVLSGNPAGRQAGHAGLSACRMTRLPDCLILLTLISLIFLGCEKTKQPDIKITQTTQAVTQLKEYYTCSMHPQVKQDQPGQCPICNMNLVKVEANLPKTDLSKTDSSDIEQEDIKASSDKAHRIQSKEQAGDIIGKVKLKKSQLAHFRPEFFPVTQMKMQKSIRLLGSVLASENRESQISARIDGRIERVYVQSTGSFIQVGDPVIDFYSPQLITTGQEYLINRKSYQESPTEDFKDLQSQSEERLKAWGIKKFQYESWFKKGRVPQKITIYSSARGTVRKRNASVGKYFKEGQHFFELSDLKNVWVEMDVYEHDANLVQLNQTVQLQFTALPGEIFSGKIDFIDPILNANSRTLKIRTTISNVDGKLKPGMVADATLNVEFQQPSLVVPRTAVINTGKRKVVWVKLNKDSFQSKVIHTGYESEGYIEVKSGLIEGEEVVMEGNFLLDAQAQLFGGYEDI